MSRYYTWIAQKANQLNEYIRSAETLEQQTEQLLSAAQTAVVRLRNKWNHRAGSALDVLPREMWISILAWLPLADRVVALSTSRDLRDIALADPALWSFGEIDCIAALQFIRRKSGSIPLNLHVVTWGGTDFLLREIRGDILRIQALHVSLSGSSGAPDHVDRLLACSLPLLQDFRLDITPGFEYQNLPFIAPPPNLAVFAPRLKTVDIGVYVNISTDMQPLPHITHFAITLPPAAGREQFFTLLPNVRTLSLIGGRGVLPLGPPPPSLAQLSLKHIQDNVVPEALEYQAAFKSWGNHLLDDFEIGIERAEGFQPALEMVVRSWPVGRSFALDLNLDVKRGRVRFGQKLEIETNYPFSEKVVESLRMVLASSQLWDAISSLSLDRYALLGIVHAELAFPKVMDLILVFTQLSPASERHLTGFGWKDHLRNQAGRPRTIHLPSLQRVKIIQSVSSIVPQQLRGFRMAPGPFTNAEYGHHTASVDVDRRVLMITRLGPQILRYHVSRVSEVAAGKLESIQISVPRKVATHASETGVGLAEAYGGLAETCTVEAINDSTATFGTM